MALEVLDQFVNSEFCIARGSLVWCLKSQYLEILIAELPNTFQKPSGYSRHKYPHPPPPPPPATTLQAEFERVTNILVNGQYTTIDISPLVIHKIYQT